ncbi:MAG TPA: hypothetical protein DD670_02940 [Planctomycetaceae bacterium]|nr:hypothetical protein [Planctomycetaceae bacterium]
MNVRPQATPRLRVLCIKIAAVAILVALAAALSPSGLAAAEKQWYKGHTHCHSLWSDGDQFPELVLDWYKSRGYDFACLSDHNVLMEDARWYPLNHEKRPVTPKMLDQCRGRFGEGWLELRGEGDGREVRLKTYEEIRKTLEEPGKFLMIQAEEVTGKCKQKEVHVNAINLVELVEPRTERTVIETIQADLAAVRRQAEVTGRRILAHVNHPNWRRYDITAFDLAEAIDVRFFELCNNCHDINNLGDATHPSSEKLWDIANTIRLTKLQAPVIFGVGSDDTHHYHVLNPENANPGRAWIVVRAEKLEIEPLLAAMEQGDFYASTGVVLKDLQWNPDRRTLQIEVDPKPGVQYVIEFVGTTGDADPTGCDTAKIGQVLARHQGTKAEYQMKDDELYVRAVVRSDRKLDNPPSNSIDLETAWTQPVGWERFVTNP